MPSSPLVSVLLTTYNRLAFLKTALRSVRRQTFRDLETIVLDGGSADDSLRWLDQNLHSGERLIRLEANPGPVALMNAGLRAAGGRFVAFLEADDYWLPDYLESMLREFRAGAVQWVSSGCRIIEGRRVIGAVDARGTRLPRHDPLLLKLTGCNIHCLMSMSMARRSIFSEIGLFDPAYKWIGMDMDFVCRLALARGPRAFGHADRILAVRRHHPEQITDVPGPWHWKTPTPWGRDCVASPRQREFYLDLALYYCRYRNEIEAALKESGEKPQ